MLRVNCRRCCTLAYTRRGGAPSLKRVSALRLFSLHCSDQRRGVANNCLVYLHPLHTKVPPLYNTASVAGLLTIRMASSSEGPSSKRVESEDRLEIKSEKGRDRASSSENVHSPIGGVVKQVVGDELGQEEKLDSLIEDYQQVPHEQIQGREGLIPDDEVDDPLRDDEHQRVEEIEQHIEGEGPSCSHSKGEGSKGETGGGAETMDVQQSAEGEAVAEGLIPRGKFTSEIYKVEVRNLPNVGYANLKMYLHKQNLDPVKCKIPRGKTNVAFITFRNEAAREFALNKLNGLQWKGRTLKAKHAKATEDPYLKKHRQDSEGSADESSSSVAKKPRLDTQTPEESMFKAVTPLWDRPYEDQLQYKMNQARKAIRAIARAVKKSGECEWLTEQQAQNNGLMCPLEQILPSPMQSYYRNKCEFTIGPSPDGKDNTLGFRIGSYRAADLSVVPPYSCLNVPEKMKEIVRVAQQCISDSAYRSFNPVNHNGHWTMLSVRCYSSGETMAMFQFHPQDLPQEEIERERERIKAFFDTGPGSSLKLTSVFFHVQGRRLPGQEPSGVYRLLLGSEHVHETVLGLTFRISNEAFFQVNTSATEVLYKKAGEWCGVTPSSTLYDICCGTGTIGLTLAHLVKNVVGIEVVAQAVEDAKVNAQINKIFNAEFHCGRAEDILPQLVAEESSADVVGILDPPRGGISSQVIKAIRKCEGLTRLVFLACSPENSSTVANFVGLCRPSAKKTPGRPFRPTKAIAVDMFPHTNHYELVLLFERAPVEVPTDPTADTTTPTATSH